jgi:exopolyphosphatase/guanosine-5'-triphosphate,3'-diphosphate pyrophosphatase
LKIAAIDLGSNSLHMVIVEVGAKGAFRVVDREADMVRLGSGSLNSGRLSDLVMDRTLATLKAYRRLAQSHKVEEVIAVATSAIREAENGDDFLDRMGRKTGIWTRAISGEEEARLDYLAALNSIHLDGARALVIDIGGGSMQLALGRGKRVSLAASEKLGVLRMTERFVQSDPISSRDEKRLRDHVRETIAAHVKRIKEFGPAVVVGTSGTILALGRLAYEAETGQKPESLHHLTISAEAVKGIKEKLRRTDLRGRLKISGLDERRADIIVAGAIVLDELLSGIKVEKLVLSEWALREGILLEFIQQHQRKLIRAAAYPDLRRRSVLDLAERCLHDSSHARHVARLALNVFDATRLIHNLDPKQRSLLEFATLLHDVGHHISHTQHHLHSYYLIKHGDLRGFDPAEIEMMANVARYHRRSGPKKKHGSFASLSRPARRSVTILAGILRLADALDRSHRKRVRAIKPVSRAGGLLLRCEADGNVDLEMWGARRRTDLLEKGLGTKIELESLPVRKRAGARKKRSGGE